MKKTLISLLIVLFVFASTKVAKADAAPTMIRIDGSSTVYLLTEAVAEEFQKGKRDVRVTVGISGTGGGFKKFASNEIDIANASREIEAGEIAKAKQNKIDYTELQVAYDGIAVVVNPKNTFLTSISIEDLKKIWEPNSKVKKWSDLNPAYPAQDIHLYGPGADSGTFDYFTKVVNGKEKAIRSDFTSSENDNVLVQGVAGDQYAMGYFGFAYFKENASRLKVLSIGSGKSVVSPTPETIKNGTYKPLSRPLFIYVNNKSLLQPKIQEFVNYYMTSAAQLAPQVGYVSMDTKNYDEQMKKLKK